MISCETARTPLSGICCYIEPLDADSIDDPRSSHLGCDPLEICAVAREHSQGEGGYHSTSLNVGNGVVGETSKHQESDVCTMADNSPGDEFELSNSAPDIGNDISSCL